MRTLSTNILQIFTGGVCSRITYKNVRRGRGGETDSTEVELGRAREATGTQCSHAQMHSGNAASVAIHPREKQTHTPSDSDEVGVRETPD